MARVDCSLKDTLNPASPLPHPTALHPRLEGHTDSRNQRRHLERSTRQPGGRLWAGASEAGGRGRERARGGGDGRASAYRGTAAVRGRGRRGAAPSSFPRGAAARRGLRGWWRRAGAAAEREPAGLRGCGAAAGARRRAWRGHATAASLWHLVCPASELHGRALRPL